MQSLTIEQVVLARIKIAKTQSEPDEDTVKALMRAFKDGGDAGSVTVCRPAPQMGVHLVSGRAVYEAHRRLGHRLIPAHVEQGGQAEAARWKELSDIDKALSGRRVSPAHRAKLLLERVRVHDMLHPGVPGFGNGFASETAAATGRGRATIKVDIKHAGLGKSLLDRVTGTSLDAVGELNALTQMEEEEREMVVERAARGEDVSATTPTPGFSKILGAWNAADPHGRAKFLRVLKSAGRLT